MPDSTHFNHGVEINLEMVTAGSEEISVNELTEEQLQEFQQTVLKRLSAMSPKEFFRDACNVFDSAADHATGWMIAHMGDDGGISILDKKRDQMLSVSVALKNPDLAVFERVPFKSDAHKDVELPNGYFWLSVEEAIGNSPVFLVGTGDLGPLVNIGTYLKMADRWDVDEMFEEPGLFAENVLDALERAENPSHAVTNSRVYEEGFQFNQADLREFLDAHRPNLVDDVDWPVNPAP
jgi:hypothetical protein